MTDVLSKTEYPPRSPILSTIYASRANAHLRLQNYQEVKKKKKKKRKPILSTIYASRANAHLRLQNYQEVH